MTGHFYFGIYETQNEANVRVGVLKARGYTVSGPKKYLDGAVNYSDSGSVKKASTVNFGECYVVTGEI